MTVLHLDIESFSLVDLKKAGLYKYSESSTTELLCASYAFDDGPVTLWVPRASIPDKARAAFLKDIVKGTKFIVSLTVPADLRKHIEDGLPVWSFNAAFERVVLNGAAGTKVKFPKLSIEQMVCVAVMARAAGMPGDLGGACVALGTAPKSEAGHLVMLQLARPRKPSKEDPNERWSIDRAPDKYAQLWGYCVGDTIAEADLGRHLPAVSEDEWANYRMDQRLNDRGIYVDLKAVDDFLYLIEQRKAELAERCFEVTGAKPTQREQIANWIRANGYAQLTDLQADTVKQIVEADVNCPVNVKEILTIYSTYGMKAVAKFKTLKEAACADGRLRGAFVFYGAGTTGRWSSKLVQLQNLFRSVIDDCDMAFDVVKTRDLDWVKLIFAEEPMRVFASCIRGAMAAPPDARLMAIDFSGIESRYGAWVFDENWKTKVFRDYDTILGYDGKKPIRKGFDNYVSTYASIFDIPPKEVTKDQRQQAKPIELALLYEGGVFSFVTMASNYQVDLKVLADSVWSSLDAEALDSAEWMWGKFGKGSGLDKRIYLACDSIKWMWRQAHPKITQGWKDLKAAAIAAIQHPGEVYGIPNKKVMFKIVDRWLVMLLPSGRKLRYFEPRVTGEGRDAQMTYLGVDTDTRRWMRTSIYGGAHCLAAGTEVLTHTGWKVIEQCTTTDLLWDGAAWVRHDGLAVQGSREVIEYAGVKLTGDHEVLTNDGWKTAALAQSEGLDWQTVCLPNYSELRREPQGQDILERPMHLRNGNSDGGSCADSGAGSNSKILRLSESSQRSSSETSAGERLGGDAGALPEAESSRLAQLRREGDSGLQEVAAAQEFREGYAAHLQTWVDIGPKGQQWPLLQIELSMGDKDYTGEQSTRQQSHSHAARSDDGGTSVARVRDSDIDDIRTSKARLGPKRFAETYDLVNAGPQQRFTVRGRDSELLIVHNCNHVCQGGSSDLLRHGMRQLENEGYKAVMTIHDEVVLECGEAWNDFETAKKIYVRKQPWAHDFPLACEGFEAQRFRK